MCSVKKYNLLAILLLCFQQFTEAAKLRCYKGSLDEFTAVSLEESIPHSFIDCIDKGLPSIVYTFGFKGRVSGLATTAVLKAYLETKKRNVLLVDWEEEAKSGMLGIALGYALNAVPNAKKIGKQLGAALVSMSKAGVNMSDFHLMGHSLGAHVMGFAGKEARQQGQVVSRITGLDPASALFDGTFAIKNGLDKTCAQFVDIIHTDPFGYGTSTSAGTVDIWPNYKGRKSTQPGCKEGDFEKFTRDELCSHDRAWQYYTEAIAAPTSFPAVYAPDQETWATQNVDYNKTILLGELTNTRAVGNYYLSTNEKPPFGRGVKGLQPRENQSRMPRESTTTISIITTFVKYFR